MTRTKLPRLIPWIVVPAIALTGFASAAPRHGAHQAPAKAAAASKPATPCEGNDFPTQARVEFVMQCMEEHGGQTLGTMYHCVCAVDKIAARMNHQEYSEAVTFTNMYNTPGEKGGEFRDPPKSKALRDKLKAAREEAEGCFPAKPAGAGGEKK